MRGYSDFCVEVALCCGKRHLSSRQFFAAIDDLAGGLWKLGIRKGDTVAICLPNTIEAVTAIYALNRIGAVASVIHPKLSAAELETIVSAVKPKMALVCDINCTTFMSVLSGIKTVFCSLLLGGFVGIKTGGDFTPHHSDGSETAVLMHSGGTTGSPKTLALSSRSVNALVCNLFDSLGHVHGVDDAMLVALPIFHGFGFVVGVHASLCCRMKAVLCPAFKPEKICKTMEREHVNTFIAIPRMLEKLLNSPSFYGATAGRLKHIYVGGDALDENLRLRFDAHIAAYGSASHLQPGYGLSEMGSVCVLNYSDVRPNSIGKPLVGVECRIVGEDLAQLPTGEIGELLLSGEQVFDGYPFDAAATEQALVQLDGKTWLRTGDYAVLDEDGYLYFKGRKKRLIKISGINVFPSEIERVACSVDNIEACACVERTGANRHNYIEMYLVTKNGEHDDKLTECVMSAVKARLSHWCTPRKVTYLDEMPRTGFGKIDFKALENRK